MFVSCKLREVQSDINEQKKSLAKKQAEARPLDEQLATFEVRIQSVCEAEAATEK